MDKLNFPTDPAELATLVDEVAGMLADLTKAEAKTDLAKSEESSSKEESEMEKSVPAPSMEKEETPPSDEPAPTADEPSAPAETEGPPAESAPAESPEGPPADGSAPADPAAEGADMSVEDLASMYAQLSPEQLEMHKQAIMMIESQGQGAAPADPAASAAPPPPAGPSAGGPPPPSAPAPDMMAMKSEAKIKELEEKLTKAMDEAKAAREEMSKTTSGMVEVLEKMAAPKSKAVTGITFHKFVPAQAEKPLRKSLTEMSREEIKVELKEIVKDNKLSKADRELINDYVLYPDRVSADKLAKFFNPSK